jgi:hypothetical protein
MASDNGFDFEPNDPLNFLFNPYKRNVTHLEDARFD